MLCRQGVSRTDNATTATIHYMRVDHGSRDIRVTQQFLHRADVVAALQQVGREGMAQGVRRGRLGNSCLDQGALDGPLQGLFVRMVPPLNGGAWIG